MTFLKPKQVKSTSITIRSAVAIGMFAASVISANAATYYGGFEDTIKGDYDYNDLVFSISSPSLALNSSGSFFAKPTLNSTGAIGQNGSPFWNNVSLDGSAYNVGYCIYGGGNCHGGIALDPTAQYLAANKSATGSANDVTFSVLGDVSANVVLTVSADRDVLGWFNVATPQTINYFKHGDSPIGIFTFTPNGNFGLVGNNNYGTGQTYYSDVSAKGNTSDNVSHFAFFADPVSTPEPGTWGLLGSALAGIAVLRRKMASKR